MGLVRVDEPISLAVSLSEAKKQCEVADSDTSHDTHITRLIKSAVADVERHTRRALVTQVWRMALSGFPDYRRGLGRIILPRPPLQNVEAIEYIDDFGNLQVLADTVYQVTIDASPGYISPAFGESWPTTRPETLEAVSVTYTAGYGDLDTKVPEQFRNVVYELIAFRFMNRGDVDVGIPKHIKWSLDSLKCGAAYGYYGVKN
jgi:uncharacterized phiE125 gp8 family phage protein